MNSNDPFIAEIFSNAEGRDFKEFILKSVLVPDRETLLNIKKDFVEQQTTKRVQKQESKVVKQEAAKKKVAPPAQPVASPANEVEKLPVVETKPAMTTTSYRFANTLEEIISTKEPILFINSEKKIAAPKSLVLPEEIVIEDPESKTTSVISTKDAHRVDDEVYSTIQEELVTILHTLLTQPLKQSQQKLEKVAKQQLLKTSAKEHKDSAYDLKDSGSLASKVEQALKEEEDLKKKILEEKQNQKAIFDLHDKREIV